METPYESLRNGEARNPGHTYSQAGKLRAAFTTDLGDGLPYGRFRPPFPKHEGQPCYGCEMVLPWHCSVRLPGPDGRPRLVDAHQCLGPDIDSYPKLPKRRTPYAR